VTWRPEPQPECEPGCTCDTPVREYLNADERAMLWPDVPAETFGRWIERTDPAPTEAPLEPEARAWAQSRQMVVTGDVHTQIDYDKPHIPLIRRILNATNRKATK
jgi:hypothetical protein